MYRRVLVPCLHTWRRWFPSLIAKCPVCQVAYPDPRGPSLVNPATCSLNPNPSTPNPESCTLDPKTPEPRILDLQPQTPNFKPQNHGPKTSNPKPQTQNPTLQTQNPKLQTRNRQRQTRTKDDAASKRRSKVGPLNPNLEDYLEVPRFDSFVWPR